MKFSSHSPKEIVEFNFMRNGGSVYREKPVPVNGKKTLKLFWSWFCLMNNFDHYERYYGRRLLFGILKFVDTGETWIWQNPKRVYERPWTHNGWQRVIPPDFAKVAGPSAMG